MIADFVIGKINAYIAGGMSVETAAWFTMGELSAIYRETHYSRDNSGAFRITPPPEDIPIETAREKCNEAIKEILDYCKKEAATKRPLNTEPKQGVAKSEAPGNAAQQELSGFEKMAEYARNPA